MGTVILRQENGNVAKPDDIVQDTVDDFTTGCFRSILTLVTFVSLAIGAIWLLISKYYG